MKTEQAKQVSETLKKKCQTTAGVIFRCMDVICESDGKGGAFGVQYADGAELPKLKNGRAASFFIGEATECEPVVVRHSVKKVDEEWQVVCYLDGKRNEAKTYFAMDKKDAEDTKRAMDAAL